MRIPSTTRTAKSARTRRSLTLLGVLILLALGGWAVVATAVPKVATPTISSGPSGATSATTATFAFRAGTRGDTLECSLDGAAFAVCTSPKTYGGLRDGAHRFQVRERNARLGAGDPATRTWSVDTQAPPAPQITQAPPAVTNVDHATFAYSDGEANVTYECKVDGRDYQTCTDPVTWRGLHDGARTFTVRARDAAGNRGPATSHGWTIDTVAPPKPTLTQKPPSLSASSSATFAFADREAGASFECALDNGALAVCTTPKAYGGLANGTHTFAVRALDAAGNRSGSTTYAWRVAAGTSGLPFTISGGYGGQLFPGKTAALALRVANPNATAILVTSLTVTVQSGSSHAGCDGVGNLTLTQSNVSDANPLTVPANGSVTLPAGGVSAPSVTMLNLATNQDACQGALFTFAYSGSSHS
jgi:large repetitive protein